MRRVLLVALTALTGVPISGFAAEDPVPVVTVTSGPTTEVSVFSECNDAGHVADIAEAFIVRRDAPNPTPLEVTYTARAPKEYTQHGSAKPGVNYEPLPGSVTIPANAASVEVPVTAIDGELSKFVDLDITLSAADGYAIGDPSEVRLTLFVHRDPALGLMDCNPTFQLGTEATNHEQTIRVGQRPVPIITTHYDVYMRLTAGQLPPGISIADDWNRPPSQGEFDGAATTPGDYAATLDVCPSGIIVFTCRTTDLVVHVLPAESLPFTGSRAPVVALTGLALLLFGFALSRSSRRRPA